jgi:hypothetical protein
MTGKGSWRSTPLPGNWGSIRRAVLLRDPICMWGRAGLPDEEGRCGSPSDECDHMGEPDDHREVVLRGLCHEHHKERSRKQNSEAVSAGMKRWWGKRLMPQPKHPGFR